jgi:transposase InsO family protein
MICRKHSSYLEALCLDMTVGEIAQKRKGRSWSGSGLEIASFVWIWAFVWESHWSGCLHTSTSRCLGMQRVHLLIKNDFLKESWAGCAIFFYLLRGLEITRPNHVWMWDITYIKMPQGFGYLVVLIDVSSWKVISWWLSNTIEVDFCLKMLEEPFCKGSSEMINRDQGSLSCPPKTRTVGRGEIYL